MRRGYPSKLRKSVVGCASAGFAEAVKMPRVEARGASLIREGVWLQEKHYGGDHPGHVSTI